MFKVNSVADANGTSFHGATIRTTPGELVEVFGKPSFEGDKHDKVQMDWSFENEEGEVFTVYDWKQFVTLDPEMRIEFHIGSKTPSKEGEFVNWLNDQLS